MRIGRDVADTSLAQQAVHEFLGSAGLGEEARGKTVTTLTRVWIAPEARARVPLEWARTSLWGVEDLRAVHFCALLASYPFFGDVCAIVGRTLALEESVRTPELRKKMRAVWGDRRTVHNAGQRAVKTLRAFDVLTGAAGSSVSQRGTALSVTQDAGRWVAHTLLLARAADAVDERELRTAPELFALALT
jgi:hypothetical protein